MAWSDNKNRPKYVTKKKAHLWQGYVDGQIRRAISRGKSQDDAVERALDARDAHIKAGDTPPKYGRKSKSKS
jgi:hypothetical protein